MRRKNGLSRRAQEQHDETLRHLASLHEDIERFGDARITRLCYHMQRTTTVDGWNTIGGSSHSVADFDEATNLTTVESAAINRARGADVLTRRAWRILRNIAESSKLMFEAHNLLKSIEDEIDNLPLGELLKVLDDAEQTG